MIDQNIAGTHDFQGLNDQLIEDRSQPDVCRYASQSLPTEPVT
jgi:hypothetical protein